MAWKLARYLKAAFVNRWNLLGVAGGAAFALISGQPDVVLPLVAAGELAYLGFVGTHPKFQTYIDVQQRQAAAPQPRTRRTRDPEKTAMRLLKALPPDQRDRFKALRSRLLELREIARDIKRHHDEESGGTFSLEGFQLEGLDRLLWIFLRLQYTKRSISRFLERTEEQSIIDDIQGLEKRLAAVSDDEDPEHAEKVRATLMDNLETSRARLDNYRKAAKNLTYIDLELDRLENKIKSLAELAINRQEPTYITSQVDQVASSLLDTEATMNELDFVTHLSSVEEETPELLRDTIYIGD